MYTLDMVSKHSKYNSFWYVTPNCSVYHSFERFRRCKNTRKTKGFPLLGGTHHTVSAVLRIESTPFLQHAQKDYKTMVIP